jgi:hypothetical protein
MKLWYKFKSETFSLQSCDRLSLCSRRRKSIMVNKQMKVVFQPSCQILSILLHGKSRRSLVQLYGRQWEVSHWKKKERIKFLLSNIVEKTNTKTFQIFSLLRLKFFLFYLILFLFCFASDREFDEHQHAFTMDLIDLKDALRKKRYIFFLFFIIFGLILLSLLPFIMCSIRKLRNKIQIEDKYVLLFRVLFSFRFVFLLN